MSRNTEGHLQEFNGVKTVPAESFSGVEARAPFGIPRPLRYSNATKMAVTHFDEETFVMRADVRDFNFNIWAMILSDERTAQKYEVKIAVLEDANREGKQSSTTAAISMRGGVFSVYQPIEEVLSDPNGVLKFNKKVARKLTHRSALGDVPEISFEFKINKK